jgi:hypothetical protein
MSTIADVASSVDKVMGVKAVWGHTDRLLCFVSRGSEYEE